MFIIYIYIFSTFVIIKKERKKGWKRLILLVKIKK